jgi:hypothetical protein
MIVTGAGKWLTRVTDPADKKRKNSRINSVNVWQRVIKDRIDTTQSRYGKEISDKTDIGQRRL